MGTATAPARSSAALGFYGWRIVAVAFLAQGLATGVTVYVYGVFLKPLTAEFDVSRMVAGLGLSALYAVQALISPVLGRELDRRSIRNIMLTGALLMGGGMALLSATSALWQVGLVFALVVGVGSTMAGPLAASTLVANWFVAHRGRALGIAAVGMSFCGFFLPPIATALIESMGWRSACLVLGVGTAGVLAPLLWAVVVSRPEERGLAPDGLADAASGMGEGIASSQIDWTTSALLRERDFWSIAGAIGLLAAALVALLTHLVAYATDLGIEPQRAAYLMSVVAGFSIAGKLSFGAIVDRFDKRRTFWLMVGIQGLGWSLLLSEPGFAALVLAAACLGLGAGGNMPISGALVGATFGRAMFGRVMGLMGPVMLILTVITPPLAGHLYDRTGSYQLAFRLLFVVTLFAAVPIAFLRTRAADPDPALGG